MTQILCPIFAGLNTTVLALFRQFWPFCRQETRYRNSDITHNSLIYLDKMVGATGIEPVTPTVSR